jgi:tetratricopeptide (TPR) repeat protein
VVAIQEKVLGREHAQTLTSEHNLAVILEDQGLFEEAEAIYRQTLATKEDMVGHEYPSTLRSVKNLAVLLAKRGCYGESLALFDRACAGLHEALGEDHPETRQFYESRARYACWEHTKPAVIQERNLPGIRDLTDQFLTRRAYGASTALYDKAYVEFREVLGEDHPTSRECHEDRSRLASWLHARSSAEADTSADTPFGQESIVSQEMVSITSTPVTPEKSVRAPAVEEETTIQVKTPTDRSSPKTYHRGSERNVQSSRIPRWLGKPEIQSPRRKITLQSSVTSMQQKNMSFRNTHERGNLKRNKGAKAGANELLTHKT